MTPLAKLATETRANPLALVEGAPALNPPKLPDQADAFRRESVSRMADRVAEQIRSYIVDNQLETGQRLPSERRLAELVGSSRPTVSQALRSLSLEGLVTIRPGAGAFVLRDPGAMVDASLELMLRLEPDSLPEAAHLRFLLELSATRRALVRKPLDLSRLQQALTGLREAKGHPSEWIAADTVFHLEAVSLSGNQYLTSLYSSLHTTVVRAAYNQWVTSTRTPAWLKGEQFEKQIALHEPIADALRLGHRRALDRALIVHEEALLSHLGVRVDDWTKGL
jgi:GntR family transcriptional repressor for pyruvate dehydrogenase complex